MNAAGSAVGEVADAVGSKVEQLVEMVDENILDYCTLDKTVCACVNGRDKQVLHAMASVLDSNPLTPTVMPPAGRAAKKQENAWGEGAGVSGRSTGAVAVHLPDLWGLCNCCERVNSRLLTQS